MAEEIKLTLTPTTEITAEQAKEATVEQVQFDESSLTESEKNIVNEFAKQIDISNSTQIIQYGSSAQTKIAEFTDSALGSVRTMDMGEVGGMVTDLIGELKNFSVDQPKTGIFGWFRKKKNNIEALKTKYDKAEVSVEKIVCELEGHQDRLVKDIAVLDKLYEVNLTNFKELSMYIIAGKKKLDEARSTELVALQEKAAQSGLPEDAQAANDYAALCDRFEKRIYDLELTRMVSIQTAPQIRLVQNNDSVMSEKIQSTIVNTIPLWKGQMVIALGLAHSQEALNAQSAVTDMTNDLLKKNAENLHMATVATAKEAERGIVDIETLQYTNQQLIATLDEVMKIQDEGKAKRKAAENELSRIEVELKDKLIEASQVNH